MALPKVVIVGRPNVGKSSLFNALAGLRISIVEPSAGVTRDRISTVIEREDRYFELLDTGGYGITDSEQLSEQITAQIHLAIESADLVLFVADVRDGMLPLDETISRLLHKSGIEVIGVANKADTAGLFPAAAEFAAAGFGEFLCVSAKNRVNTAPLVERILAMLPAASGSDRPERSVMKIAVVGKRNAGKSTLVNAAVGSQRLLVSETPGTTRDAVDVHFQKDGRTVTIIDTAGVRKKSRIADSIEFYSHVRAVDSIRRADVVLFLIDAATPVSGVDKSLAAFIVSEHKSCVLVINKWDLAKGVASTESYAQYLTRTLPHLQYATIVFTTATTGKNVQTALDAAAEIFKQASTWIPTARLNKAFEIMGSRGLPGKKAGPGTFKVYYAAQVAVNPVTILMFANKPRLFDENYSRFAAGRLRQLLGLEAVPIRLLARSRKTPAGKPGGKHK
jgi:GTP-binding protein